MKRELQEKLIKDFPDLCSERDLPSPFAFGFECGDGWYELIYNLCRDIVAIDSEVRIAQVKEKFGGLRFYIYKGIDEVHTLIDKAEEKSYTICEECGEEGKLREGGWLVTLCDDCNNKRNETD